MSIKKFLRRRADKAELIDDVKEVILDGSPKKLRRYKKFGLETLDDFIQFFMGMGNTTLNSGDPEVFRYFLETLFELAGAGRVDISDVLGKIKYYGVRAINNYDFDTFMLILESYFDHICLASDVFYLNSCLGVLSGLAQKALSEGFDEGLAELVDLLVRLNVRFNNNGMQVNRFYLKNVAISLIDFADRNDKVALKNRLITDLDGVMDFVCLNEEPFALVEELPAQYPEGVEGQSSSVA